MVDERIEDITGGELTELDVADLLVILDASDTTDDPQGTVKRIAYQNVGKLPLSNESAGFTAVRNTHHRVTVGTAARTVTMPSAGLLDGDRVRITVAAQGTAVGSFAQAPGHAVGFANPTSINNVSYTETTTGKWSLWLTGEMLLLEWDATLSTWWIVQDDRTPQDVSYYLTSDFTMAAASTWDQVEGWTKLTDLANVYDSANFGWQIKRRTDRLYIMKIRWLPTTNARYINAISESKTAESSGLRSLDLQLSFTGDVVLGSTGILTTNGIKYVLGYSSASSSANRIMIGASTVGTVLTIKETLV